MRTAFAFLGVVSIAAIGVAQQVNQQNQKPRQQQAPVVSGPAYVDTTRPAMQYKPLPAPPEGAPGAQPFLPPYLTAAQYSPTDEESQPMQLPPLPAGMTTDMIVSGDQIFHGAGGCSSCHGMEGTGEVKAGAAITIGLLFVDQHQWGQIDSLIRSGISDAVTRAPIRMPARGAKGDLSEAQVRDVAAYVWAISNTRGEPWPGGHQWHSRFGPPAHPRTDGP